MFQRLVRIRGIDHATDAHDRHLRQRVRTHCAVFFDKRGRILRVDNRRTQGCANGEVQVIHTARGQLFQQVHGIFKADARLFQLFRGEAIADDKGVIGVLAHHFMGDVEHGQREFRAVIAAATPLVVMLVRVWRVELLNQIGVGPMDFNAIETRLNRTAYCFTELTDHPFDFFSRQGNRRGGAVTWRGNGTWPHRRAATDQFRVNHAAAVVDLQQRFRSFGLNRLSDLRQPGDFLVVINANRTREGETEIVNKAALNNNGTNTA